MISQRLLYESENKAPPLMLDHTFYGRFQRRIGRSGTLNQSSNSEQLSMQFG